jgi:hypothetical protein
MRTNCIRLYQKERGLNEVLEEHMPQRLVEITSEHPTLLPSIVKAKQGSPYTIIEREGNYYLSFVDTDDPMNTQKAKQDADILLANINAMLALPPYRTPNALKRTNRIITIDDNGREVGESTLNVAARFRLGPDFSTMDFSNLLEMEVNASKLTRIKQALLYYADGFSWFKLYDIYECIRKDCKEVNKSAIPQQWTTDAQGNDRLKDFTECANNAFISGYAARHSFADSNEIDRITDTLAILKKGNVKIDVMTLNEAGSFIENLMVQW